MLVLVLLVVVGLRAAKKSSTSTILRFSSQIQDQDTVNFLDALDVLMGSVSRGHDLFGLRATQVRAAIRHDAVAAIRRISPPSIADDRMVRDMVGNWEGIHRLDKRVFGRKGIDARGKVRLAR